MLMHTRITSQESGEGLTPEQEARIAASVRGPVTRNGRVDYQFRSAMKGLYDSLFTDDVYSKAGESVQKASPLEDVHAYNAAGGAKMKVLPGVNVDGGKQEEKEPPAEGVSGLSAYRLYVYICVYVCMYVCIYLYI